MSKTPWTDNHERVGKIRSSGAVMCVVPAVYVRELEKQLTDAKTEIERKDELIKEMSDALKLVVSVSGSLPKWCFDGDISVVETVKQALDVYEITQRLINSEGNKQS